MVETSLRAQVDWRQYDAEDLTWGNEGDGDSPYRRFIARHLLPFIGDVQNQSVLDVGCGTGWLLHSLGQKGAKPLTGVEPSHYADLAAKLYPEATIYKQAFLDFQTTENFDLITAVMSIDVMDDLPAVFSKFKDLQAPGGRLVVCKGDYDYFLADKYDYVLRREEIIPGHETVVRTDRPTGYGTTIDIYRTNKRVIDVATQVGWQLTKGPQPVLVDAQAVEEIPRYQAFAGKAIMDLLEFRMEGELS